MVTLFVTLFPAVNPSVEACSRLIASSRFKSSVPKISIPACAESATASWHDKARRALTGFKSERMGQLPGFELVLNLLLLHLVI